MTPVLHSSPFEENFKLFGLTTHPPRTDLTTINETTNYS